MRKTKIDIDCQDIKYFIVNERGKIIDTGEKDEEKDTFQDTLLDLKTVEIGEYPSITFNRKVFTTLNYKVTDICKLSH